MAIYKHLAFLQQHDNQAFDVTHTPGTPTPYSGIYRCHSCGENEVSTFGHPLPPQNHHQHSPPAPILWRLIVATK
jgi:hypothetical protein